MSELTIGAVAARAEVATSAVRYWEEQGLLDRARRRGGRRVYDPSIHQRVALIQLAQRAGFTIPEIRTLVRGFPPRASAGERWRALVGRKQAEVRGKIGELERMLEVLARLAGCVCPDLDACGDALRGAETRGQPRSMSSSPFPDQRADPVG